MMNTACWMFQGSAEGANVDAGIFQMSSILVPCMSRKTL